MDDGFLFSLCCERTSVARSWMQLASRVPYELALSNIVESDWANSDAAIVASICAFFKQNGAHLRNSSFRLERGLFVCKNECERDEEKTSKVFLATETTFTRNWRYRLRRFPCSRRDFFGPEHRCVRVCDRCSLYRINSTKQQLLHSKSTRWSQWHRWTVKGLLLQTLKIQLKNARAISKSFIYSFVKQFIAFRLHSLFPFSSASLFLCLFVCLQCAFYSVFHSIVLFNLNTQTKQILSNSG